MNNTGFGLLVKQDKSHKRWYKNLFKILLNKDSIELNHFIVTKSQVDIENNGRLIKTIVFDIVEKATGELYQLYTNGLHFPFQAMDNISKIWQRFMSDINLNMKEEIVNIKAYDKKSEYERARDNIVKMAKVGGKYIFEDFQIELYPNYIDVWHNNAPLFQWTMYFAAGNKDVIKDTDINAVITRLANIDTYDDSTVYFND